MHGFIGFIGKKGNFAHLILRNLEPDGHDPTN